MMRAPFFGTGSKANFFLSIFPLFQLSLSGVGEDLSPFRFLFKLLGTLFFLPMRGAIVPEVKIEVKASGDNPS